MLLTFTFTGKPSDAQSHKFKIHVFVRPEDENTKSLIQSWIKREFRSLGDVRIVGFNEASYILHVLPVETIYEATGRKSGDIAIAYMFYQRSVTDPFLYFEPFLGAYTGNTTRHLESLCKRIVANIDTLNLEPLRESFQGTQPPPTYKGK